MLGLLAAETNLPASAFIAVVIVGIVELALVIYCIVDIVRRPAVTGGRKWVWIVVILLFNLIGSIVYLAVGRAAPPAPEHGAGADGVTGDRAQAAVDMLYGPPSASEAAPAPQQVGPAPPPSSPEGAPSSVPAPPREEPGAPAPPEPGPAASQPDAPAPPERPEPS